MSFTHTLDDYSKSHHWRLTRTATGGLLLAGVGFGTSNPSR